MTTLTEAKPTTDRIYNFSAGPSILPEPVLRQAQEDLWNVRGSGIGILEHSHRGKVFTEVIEQAEADCREIAGISDDYAVLFLQGGATLQFAMAPMNFLASGKSADYLHTSVWTKKAVAEAKLLGNVNLAFDGAASNFDHIPTDHEITADPNAAYTWYCSNNTIFGTEWQRVPDVTTPLICDASSDIFSRPLDIKRHAMVLAGAQKNLGPSGCALVIIRRNFMDTGAEGLPSMLDYRKHAKAGSCLNTPPTFAIYVMGQVFRWIKDQGGLEAIATRNAEKAALIYDAIDGSGEFYGPVARADSRSMMNIAFRTPSEELDAQFIAEAKTHGMDGLKGHRSAGGVRASIYNAFPEAGCSALASFMHDFQQRNG